MTTHQAVIHTQLGAAGELAFTNPTTTAPAAIKRLEGSTEGPNPYQIDVPENDGVVVRIAGFTADGKTYAISAVSTIAGRTDAAWSRDGIDAVSPEFTVAGDYTVKVTADPGGGAARKLSTVTMKIKPTGKPDDFLGQFKPL